jgi:hypothetical protein
MDPQKVRDAYQRLQTLDDRLTYKVRPKPGGALTRPTPEQVEQSLRDLAAYTVELKDVLEDLFVAIASKSPAPPGG